VSSISWLLLHITALNPKMVNFVKKTTYISALFSSLHQGKWLLHNFASDKTITRARPIQRSIICALTQSARAKIRASRGPVFNEKEIIISPYEFKLFILYLFFICILFLFLYRLRSSLPKQGLDWLRQGQRHAQFGSIHRLFLDEINRHRSGSTVQLFYAW